jgi:hypothetical protein
VSGLEYFPFGSKREIFKTGDGKCGEDHKPDIHFDRSTGLGVVKAMLLSSILQMLDQYPPQSKAAETARLKTPQKEEALSLENTSGLKKIELEIAAAAGLLRPLSVMPDPTMPPPAGPSLEELIRAISKFDKSDESRVVDVFE